MERRTAWAVPSAAALAIVCTACTRDVNSRPVLGATLELDAIPHASDPEPTERIGSSGPSLVGMDRTNWEPMLFVVPVDGTVHGPTVRSGLRGPMLTERQRGAYPTAKSALELGTGSAGPEIRAAAWSHPAAFGDLIAAPFRAVAHAGETRESPDAIYRRTRGGQWLWGGASVPGQVEFWDED